MVNISSLFYTFCLFCNANSLVQIAIPKSRYDGCRSLHNTYREPLYSTSSLSRSFLKSSLTRAHSLVISSDDTQLDENERKIVLALIRGATSSNLQHESNDHAHSETLGKMYLRTLLNGYSNRIYKVEFSKDDSHLMKQSSMVVKIFSDTAKLRLLDLDMGLVDEIASHISVGPKLLFRNEHGIVMEYIHGRILSEKDIHSMCENSEIDQNKICVPLAQKVALLHKQTLPNSSRIPPNMLWFTLEKMLRSIESHSTMIPEFNYDTVKRDIEHMKNVLNDLDLPIVLAHGDLKPSNVMVPNVKSNSRGINSELKLIDFELGGYGYRGFDLCKIFRTKEEVYNEENQRIFIRHYLQTFCGKDNGKCISNDDIDVVMMESRLFEPLTWLEAAVFFAFLMRGDSALDGEWQQLAIDRLEKYFEIKDVFQQRVDNYIQHTQRQIVS